MIPTRTLRATVEISTGSMIITNRPPAFTGEADALGVVISLLDGGEAYTPVGNITARLYLYWPGTIDMSEAVELTINGSTLTGPLPDTLTAVPGCPLLVVQLTDADTQDLIVAAASPIQITNVLGERVISSRPATPSEIIYIGRAPYIDTTTGHWMQWDVNTSGYIDTGVSAAGRPATFTATATTLPARSAATASISGTPEAPVLNLGIPKGDTGATGQRGPTGSAAGFGTPTASVDANVGTPSVSVSASGPNTAKVFNFAFRNLKGQKGDTGGVDSVNGKTGAVQLYGTDIPVSSSDASSLSQQIGNLTNLETTVKTDLVSAVNENTEQIIHLGKALAYVENGDTAQLRTYAAGDFIMWKGVLYTVNSEGITQGTAITGHVTKVTGGGFNSLKLLTDSKVKCTGWRGTVKNLYTLIGVQETDSEGIFYLDVSSYVQQKPVFGIIQCLSNPNYYLTYNFDSSTVSNIKVTARNITTGGIVADWIRYSFIFCDQQ